MTRSTPTRTVLDTFRTPPPPALAAAPAADPDDGGCPSAAGTQWASTLCQCRAPQPCTSHPEDRPLLARPPASNDPAPNSPVARTVRRLAHDRALGVLPGAEPGQGVEVLSHLTDHELGAWTQALLAEHHRRQQRFLDYRRGARTQRNDVDAAAVRRVEDELDRPRWQSSTPVPARDCADALRAVLDGTGSSS